MASIQKLTKIKCCKPRSIPSCQRNPQNVVGWGEAGIPAPAAKGGKSAVAAAAAPEDI